MKQKRYWLRGGLYGLLVLAIFGFVGLLFLNSEDRTFVLVATSLLVPLFGVVFFLVGALIGWGYGKNRNKLNL